MTDPADTSNPLLRTLPPAIDYINYLIVIEHNLTRAQLPTLHLVLQDRDLAANIGWDLVHLLLPLLPESKECLQDVARLGNPREVVLKVTELLEEGTDDSDEEGGGDGDDLGIQRSVEEGKSERTNVARGGPSSAGGQNGEETDVRSLGRYIMLIEMLAILHPRIKTQYPSRFLSTSLQAVLPAYSRVAHYTVATEATLETIKTLSPSARPSLPPRRSSSRVPVGTGAVAAPDPEGQGEVVGSEESAVQVRLLQSFLTFIAEGYVNSLKAYEDVPGLAWSCRYYEKSRPKKKIPHRHSYLAMFVEEEQELHMRDTLLGQCLAFSRDLKLTTADFMSCIANPDPIDNTDEDALPTNASQIPLSRTGCLYLLCATAASSVLFDSHADHSFMDMFPAFADILANTLGESTSGVLGSEPEATIDALVFLGQLASMHGSGKGVSDDAIFNNTLQRLSLLSANTPSPTLRFQAHVLTSSVLHSHPSDETRLAFIKDTLEDCPLDNLRVSAIGWLKEEMLTAQLVRQSQAKAQDSTPSLFLTPIVLKTLAPSLLIDPLTLLYNGSNPNDPPTSSGQAEAYASFRQHHTFLLAVLNFLYLILSAPFLLEALQVGTLGKDFDIIGFCDGLRAASLLFRGRIQTANSQSPDYGRDEEVRFEVAELNLIDQSLDRVMEAAGAARLSRLRQD